jgi:hypothetical protein
MIVMIMMTRTAGIRAAICQFAAVNITVSFIGQTHQPEWKVFSIAVKLQKVM